MHGHADVYRQYSRATYQGCKRCSFRIISKQVLPVYCGLDCQKGSHDIKAHMIISRPTAKFNNVGLRSVQLSLKHLLLC